MATKYAAAVDGTSTTYRTHLRFANFQKKEKPIKPKLKIWNETEYNDIVYLICFRTSFFFPFWEIAMSPHLREPVREGERRNMKWYTVSFLEGPQIPSVMCRRWLLSVSFEACCYPLICGNRRVEVAKKLANKLLCSTYREQTRHRSPP